MNQAVVLYDGDCPMCRKTTAILKRLDWRHRLQFHNCRDLGHIPANTAHLDPERMIQEMHVLTPDRGRGLFPVSARFAGLPAVFPPCWPLYPLLFVPGMARLGQRIYLWIARNRFHLVPCHDGVCTIPPKRNRPHKDAT